MSQSCNFKRSNFFKEDIYRDCVGRRVAVKSKSTLNKMGLYPLLFLYDYKYYDHKKPLKNSGLINIQQWDRPITYVVKLYSEILK